MVEINVLHPVEYDHLNNSFIKIEDINNISTSYCFAKEIYGCGIATTIDQNKIYFIDTNII